MIDVALATGMPPDQVRELTTQDFEMILTRVRRQLPRAHAEKEVTSDGENREGPHHR